MKTVEIDQDNLKEYFVSILPKLRNLEVRSFIVEPMTGSGDSGFVFPLSCTLVSGEQIKLFIKQTRSYAKTAIDIALDPKRVKWEYENLKLFEQILGVGKVPHVYFYDSDNNIIVMSDVIGKGKLLVDDLSHNIIHTELAEAFADLFCRLHQSEHDFDSSSDNSHREWIRNAIAQYNTAGAMKILPDNVVKEILDRSNNAEMTIIWGDAKPKNIIVDEDSIRFFDLETVIKWDPAYDIGCFLSHWVIKAIEAEDKSDSMTLSSSVKFINAFIVKYLKGASSHYNDPHKIKKLSERIIDYIGVMMLHRTDGTDQYDLEGSLRNSIRKHSSRLCLGELEGLSSLKIQIERN